MNERNARLTKPTFHDLCIMYKLTYDELMGISELSGVSKDAIEDLFLGKPVERAHAEIVLEVFSHWTRQVWNLENVQVVLSGGDPHD